MEEYSMSVTVLEVASVLGSPTENPEIIPTSELWDNPFV